MLEKIISFSVRNKLIVALFTLGIIIWGSYELTRLPFDALPDITDNQVQIITLSPALGAADVERLITAPIELSTQNIQGIKQIRSFSRFGLSLVTVVFNEGVDLYWARQQIAERLVQVQSEIPQGIGSPSLAPVTTGLGEIYQYVVKAKPGYEKQYGPMELRTIQDWVIRKQLLSTPGVADVSSFGGLLKQYTIEVNQWQMVQSKITLQEIIDAINANNQNAGGSYVERNNSALFIRTEGLAENIQDLENIVLRESNTGLGIRIKDIAAVKLGHAKRFGAMCYNDQGEVAGAVVMMLKGENSMEVIANVKDKIEEIKKQLPQGVEVEAFLDRTKMVNNALSTVQTNLMEGATIVLFVLILFLGQWRAGVIVASVIPLAMLIAVGLMNLWGVSGNLMSLGALDFGLIVDGAVIVVEGVLHMMHHPTHKNMSKDDITIQSTSRIMTSAVFGQIIILIVYLPILALSGVEGKMFIPMAQTISFAIVGAFVLSLTYVPMMSALILKKEEHHQPNFSDRMINAIQKAYHKRLLQAKNHQKYVLSTAFILMIIAFGILSQMGGEFIPELEEGDFAVETRMLLGTHLNTTIEGSQKAAHLIKEKFPEVEKVVTKIGSGEIPTDPMPMEACDMIIVLKDKKEWTSAKSFDELASKMGDTLAQLPGISVGFQFPVQMRFNELMTGARQDVVCKIYGENLDTLTYYAEKLGQIMGTIEGAKDVYVESMTGMPQAVIQYDRTAIAQYGVSIASINNIIETAFAGQLAGNLYEGEKKFGIKIQFKEDQIQSLNQLENLYIDTPNHGKIPLSVLANINTQNGVNQIQREGAQRRIIIGCNVRDRDIQSTVTELQEKVKLQMPLPEFYSIDYGGTFENLQAAKARLAIAVPVSLLLIFLLLYFAFGSVGQGILIYTAIPLAAVGGVFALWLSGMPFSISAGIGFIALFGVAVLNGIVLMGEFNRLEKEGWTDTWEIILEATKTRMRPVLMTATAASLGFIPMAISSGAGAEVQRPLAVVVIGGIITATILTLFVLPLLYAYYHKRKTMKVNLTKTLSVLIITMISAHSSMHAQVADNSLTQCLQWAAQSPPNQMALMDVEMADLNAGKKAFQNESNIFGEYGHVNSMALDYRLGMTQNFSAPSYYKGQREIWKLEKGIANQQKKLTQEQIAASVAKTYRLVQVQQDLVQDWQKLISLSNEALTISEKQWKNGEINSIEWANVSQTHSRILMAHLDAKAALLEGQNMLNWWVSHQVQYPLPALDKLETFPIANAPLIVNEIMKNQIALHQSQVKMEKSKLIPNWNIGMSAMTIQGFQNVTGTDVYYNKGTWFPTINAGIQIPLPNGNQRKNIAIAEIKVKQQTALNDWQKSQLQNEINTRHEQDIMRVQLLNALSEKKSNTMDPSWNNWQSQWKSGNINVLQWSAQVSQWIDFIQTLQQTYTDCIENQYQLQMLQIHE
jgi:cobalt-zinc-cadmium resistance protein CzcA